MNEKAKFVLVFMTSQGILDEYEIPRANKALTEAELLDLMEDMCDAAKISSTEGSPSVPESAALVVTNFKDYM